MPDFESSDKKCCKFEQIVTVKSYPYGRVLGECTRKTRGERMSFDRPDIGKGADAGTWTSDSGASRSVCAHDGALNSTPPRYSRGRTDTAEHCAHLTEEVTA